MGYDLTRTGSPLSSGPQVLASARRGVREMADAATAVPGTWFLTVTFPSGNVTRAVLTFTSDGGVVERTEHRVEGAVGVWEVGDETDEFRFMFYRFANDLAVDPATGKVAQSSRAY